MLNNRLRLVADRRRQPAIADEVIRRPLFITGLPRSGTTFLHALLAQDPAHRAPQVWEVMYPSPPPERASYAANPRITTTARQLKWLDLLMPDFKTVHLIDARLPQECIAITSHDFRSYTFESMYTVPSYRAWHDRQDKRPEYEFHRHFLQHLQWRCPGQRWVLKAPSHLLALEGLLQVYPDACILLTHRDPLKVLASCASFTEVLRSGFSERVDKAALAREVRQRWEEGAGLAVKYRQAQGNLQQQLFDVHYCGTAARPHVDGAADLCALRPGAERGGGDGHAAVLAGQPQKQRRGAPLFPGRVRVKPRGGETSLSILPGFFRHRAGRVMTRRAAEPGKSETGERRPDSDPTAPQTR